MSNLGSYSQRLADFAWSQVERDLDYRDGAVLNIGWYCSDRICQKGLAKKTALHWESQGGRLFLVGPVPHGASKNNWCDGLPSAVAWDQVTDYLVFDSAEHYAECVGLYEGKKRKR